MPTYTAPTDFGTIYNDPLQPPTYRLAVVNVFVFIHKSIYVVNERLSRVHGKINHVTPVRNLLFFLLYLLTTILWQRHYLDFINHFVSLFLEKRSDLEEQQRHLNVGLDKLRDTVSKVEELRQSLAIKKTELERKTVEANDKLKKMVSDQQEAEQQKVSSLQIQKQLAEQNSIIEERRKVVLADLAEAEPAVIEAQK
jgi:dynein heavy chain 1, cytosolic